MRIWTIFYLNDTGSSQNKTTVSHFISENYFLQCCTPEKKQKAPKNPKKKKSTTYKIIILKAKTITIKQLK